MSITTAYLTSTKNVEAILNAIQGAQAPDKFTIRFLETLEFQNAADRLMIPVLKAVGFLDDAGTPTDRYFRFLDQSEGGKVLADGIREAYEDLFRINTKANELSQVDVKNKLKTLTQGQKSDDVLDKMAKTFTTLCSLADWTSPSFNDSITPTAAEATTEGSPVPKSGLSFAQLAYNIQLILPATRDPAVYDALFKSLREHLGK